LNFKKVKGYSHASHIKAVIAASRARCGARLVLYEICHKADFYSPNCAFTKQNIEDMTGLERKSIMRALKFLRIEGSIIAISGQKGGRGIVTHYQIHEIPRDDLSEQREAKADTPAQQAQELVEAVAQVMADDRGIDYTTARDRAKKLIAERKKKKDESNE
jgi:diadenosine tetraphosphate (Ap4A) HIT family hydrolase